MLTGMYQDLVMLFSQFMRDRSTFDKLRPGANNGYNLHEAAGFSLVLFILTVPQKSQRCKKNIVVTGIYNVERRRFAIRREIRGWSVTGLWRTYAKTTMLLEEFTALTQEDPPG
jgi:hypothetical protein